MSNWVSERKRERKIALIPLFSGRLVTFHTRPSLVRGRLRYTPSCESSVWELLRGAAGLFFQLVACDSCLYCALLSLCVCVCEGVTNGAYSHLPARAKGQVNCYNSLLSLAFFIICFSLVRNVAPQKVETENNGGLWGRADVCLHLCVLTLIYDLRRTIAHTWTH